MYLQSLQLLEDLLVTRRTTFPTFYGTPWIIYPVAIIPPLHPILNYFNPIDTDILYFFKLLPFRILSVRLKKYTSLALYVHSVFIHSFVIDS